MHDWGLCIQNFLTHVSLGPLDSQLIILRVVDPFHEYLRETLSGPQRLLLSRLRVRDILCTPLLTEFFGDPSRSGPFYLDGDKYATFAMNLTNYLITDMYVCESESVKYTFTSHSHLHVIAVHLLRPSFVSNLNPICFLCPFYCHRHHIQ